MTFKIQNPPEGLNQFLRFYETGRSPDQLLEEVRPVVDISSFYSTRRLEVATSVSAYGVKAAAVTQTLTVPANQYWRLHHLEARMDTASAAGDDVALAILVGLNPNQSIAVKSMEQAWTVATTGEAVRTTKMMDHVILPPGGRVVAYNVKTTVAQFFLRAFALIERLQA